jgi:predicted phosphodiesterase
MKTKEESIMSLTDVETSELLEQLQERGYFVAKTPLQRRGQTFNGDLKRWSGNKYKFGVVADTHLGSKYQQLSALYKFYRLCARQKVDTIYHCGDLTEGERMYRGQEYEIFVHGADAQTEYAVAHYPKVGKIKTKAISGNHDQSFLKHSGYNIVKAVCDQRSDMEFLGDDLAFINIDKIKIAIMHGSGGVAYARSYKSQKIVEQLASENKPHFLFLGHYHVPNIVPGYRNVETVQMGCFQSQTPYLTAKGLMPFVAGLIVTIQTDESGLAKVQYEWVPFYKAKKNDF